jgi:hypothetical protein
MLENREMCLSEPIVDESGLAEVLDCSVLTPTVSRSDLFSGGVELMQRTVSARGSIGDSKVVILSLF